MRHLFVVSGYGAAGKSTVTRALSTSLELKKIEFGTIHKTAYKNAGYNCTADWLADKGYEEYELSVLKLFEQEMDKISGDVLIDGIFSYSCYNYLKSLEMDNKNRVTNIFISTPQDERINRMYKRQNFLMIEQAYVHTKASDFIKGTCGLYRIYDDANYIIDGRSPARVINEQIKKIIQRVKSKDRIMER